MTLYTSLRRKAVLISVLITLMAPLLANAVKVYESTIEQSHSSRVLLTLDTIHTSISISLEQIEMLPMYETDYMVHFDGPEGRFAGVWLNDLLEKYGLDKAEKLRFTAHDGYEVFISKEDRATRQFLLASRLNGKVISKRDLGPLMIIVPQDYNNKSIKVASKTQWIWALMRVSER